MAIEFHRINRVNEERLLESKREAISEGMENVFEIKDEVLTALNSASVAVKRTRVLKRVTRGTDTVVQQPEPGKSYIEDYFYHDDKRKDLICLHFTAGGNCVGWLTHKPKKWAVGVHYIVSTTGVVFELFALAPMAPTWSRLRRIRPFEYGAR